MDSFKTMDGIVQHFFSNPAFVASQMVYCDYIADLIKRGLMAADQRNHYLLSDVGSIKSDLTDEGAFKSTRKTIEVTDRNGKKYLITVEEA
jgi:hypothetical protein